MKKNMKHPQQSVCFQERPLVVAIRHALPYLMGLSLALSMVQTASSRSSDSAAAFTATQLVRQFTLKNTVSQVSMGMQGYVSEINGEQRGPAMGARPTGFPSDMGSVPATVNLPRRDGAGRPLGYCAWDNSAAVATADYNAGQGISNPLVYAVVSPGLNGTMQTTCADVLQNGSGFGDDHVQVVAPMQVSSVQYKSSVGTFADLPLGVEGDVRLVRDTNKLYSYVNGAWAPVQAGPFEADASGGAGAISYTTGKVTVADFQAATATITGALSGSSATFSGAVTANTFTGNGAGLVDLNADNFSSGVLGPQFGGTGVNAAAAANGTLLIGNGSGFTLGTLTGGAGISVLSDAGAITLVNSGVISITGTADQVIASASNGDIVLSLPQAIAPTSMPTFAGMMLNGGLTGTTANFSGAVTVGSLGAQRLDVSTSAGGLATPNMIVGTGAMLGTQSGFGGNTALGINALRSNTTGYANTATGSGALISNTTGIKNTATGWGALEQNTSGSDNTVTGNEAAYVNTTGYRNTAMGARALFSNSTGYDNVAVGNNALRGNTTGFENVALGRESGFANTTGSSNTFLGYSADATTGALTYATAIGALATVATSNTLALGRNSTADQVVIGTNTRSNTYANTKLYVNGVTNLNGDLRGTTATFSGAVNALSFAGDGSALTNLNASNFTTGNVPVARGGTGLDGSAAPNGSLLIGNGTGYSLNTLTGTANQVNVTNGAGTITLSLPQSIATTSTPTFAGQTLTGGLTGTSASFSGDVTANTLQSFAFKSITSQGAHLQWNRDSAGGRTYLINQKGGGGGGISFGESTTGNVYTQNMFLDSSGNLTVVGAIAANSASTSTFGGITMAGALTGTSATFSGDVAARHITASGSLQAVGPKAITSQGTHIQWNKSNGDGRTYFINQRGLGSAGGMSFGESTTGDVYTQNMLLDSVGNLSVVGSFTANSVQASSMTLTAALTGTSGTFSGDVTANTLQSNAFKSIASSGAHLQWNRDSAGGRTYLINQRGGGGGGISFGESTTGNVYTENMALSSTGNLTVVGSVTASGGITGTTANFSGNTSVGGTLAVTGGTTLNGAVAVNNSEITFNDVVGDKLNLYTDYGFGINGNNLTAFIPSASQRFSVRTGGTYTGFEVFTVSGAGNASLTGGLAAGGAISGTAGAFTGNVTVGGSVTATGLVDAYGGVLVRDGSKLEFGPSGSTTDQIFIQRSNLATDQSRLQIILGDNNEGFGVSTTDEFQIGNIAGGTFAPRFRVAGSGDAIFSGAVTMNSLAAQRIDVSTSAGGVTNPNMIVGTNAMPGAQSGLGGNTALGVDTLSRNTTGFYNTASGFQSLTKNTIGNANTATGVFALTENTDGDFNTASGYYALTFNTTGNDNSAFGVNALITNTSGAENVAVGSRAMQSSSTGSQNVAVGFRAGFNNSTGSNNTLLGAAANVSASALTYATAIGSGSLVATSNTLALGRNSTADQVVIGTATRNDTFASTKLYVNGVTNLNGDLRGTTATFSGNTTVGGTLAVTGATTLNGAVAVNNSAITFNNILGDKLNLYSGFGFGINGDNLTAFIPSATQRFSLRTGGTYTGTEVFTVTGGGLITSTGGISTTTGAFSGAVTMNSLTAQRIDVSTSAGGVSFANMIVGTGAMAGAQSGTGANTALGINALNANTTGYANTGSGYRALELNSSGYGNTANGSDVLRSNTTGNNNTASGYFALANNTTGFDNTATGRLSGSNNTTGSSNTFLGSAADATTGALTYATAIGAGSTVATSSTIALGRIFATDQVVIGTASRNDTFANTKLYVNGVTNLNGDLRGTTGTFSGAVEVATGQELRLGTYSENSDGLFITRVNTTADQSIFRISAFENLDDFGSPVADEFQIGRSAIDRSSFTPVFRLAGSGNAILTGRMTANGGISSTTGTFSGNTTVGGTLAVTGTTTLNGAVAVNNSAITFNNVLGDKLNLFGGFGFGINGDNLTAYVPSAAQRFSLRTGGTSTGPEVFTVTGGGNTSVGGTLTVNGGISGTSANFSNNTIDSNGVIARTHHADSFKSINAQGAHLHWNREVGVGRTYLINQKGLGVGGISFGETTTANAYTQNMLLDGSGNLYVAGFVEANTFNARSDRRLKKNITAQENNSVLERLEQLQTYSYEYINTPSVGRRIGVIAQEIQGLFPEVVNTQADGMMSVDYGALGAMAAMGVGQLNSKFKVLDGKVNLQGEKLLELDGKVAQHNTRIGALESWKTEAVTRMDGMQSAIDLNIQKIAENTLAIQTNTKAIERLDDALFTLDGTVKGNTESIASINARWARNFTASEDGSSLTVNAVELKVSNFTAQQVRANSVYSQRLEAEMARIAELEVNNLRANTAVANTVQAEQVNTGSIQVYAGVGLPAVLFAAKADGHYTVSTSALDGSYATATVIVNAGQAKVVSVSSEGIELVAEGNMVKAIAAGKSIKASWIKMG